MSIIATLVKRIAVTGMVVALVGAGPAAALAETMNFKLLPRYSRATFKSDAPLETFIGTTADAGIVATLAVDPAKPQDAKGVVKVDMNQVGRASTSVTPTCAASRTSTPTSKRTAG